MINGKKTYIFSGLIVLFSILYAFGILEMEVFMRLLGIFSGLTGLALRHSVAKLQRG